jgi:hypothetical protein
LEDFFDILADEQLAEILEIGQPVEKENALHQAVGMLHLVDGFFVLELAEALHAPVVEHASVQKVLIDRGELVLQRQIQIFQYLCVALHGGLLEMLKAGLYAAVVAIGGEEREGFEGLRGLSEFRGGAAEAGRGAASLRCEREAAMAALASGTHLPQQVPTPKSRVMSRMQHAPPFTAARI